MDALDYLYERGHRTIGYIGGCEYVNGGKDPIVDPREGVFLSFMKQKKLALDHYFSGTTFSPEEGHALTKQLLSSKILPTALFVASDPMALGVYKALAEAGLQIGEDISVVSFDDIQTARFLVPSLTTVKVHTEMMGECGVQLLVEKLDTSRKISKKLVIPGELIVRDSVKSLV